MKTIKKCFNKWDSLKVFLYLQDSTSCPVVLVSDRRHKIILCNYFINGLQCLQRCSRIGSEGEMVDIYHGV